MGRFRLESYRGRSMESGSDGWDGISRAEEDNFIDDELEKELVRQALNEVPSDVGDDFVVYWDNNENYTSQVTQRDENEEELNSGDEEYERFLAEIMGDEYQSKSMSDMARDISKSVDVPTVRDVENASKNILSEMDRDNDEYDR